VASRSEYEQGRRTLVAVTCVTDVTTTRSAERRAALVPMGCGSRRRGWRSARCAALAKANSDLTSR
jgi:hypothetical protein